MKKFRKCYLLDFAGQSLQPASYSMTLTEHSIKQTILDVFPDLTEMYDSKDGEKLTLRIYEVDCTDADDIEVHTCLAKLKLLPDPKK